MAEGGQLLHEEGRRDLPGRAGQPALLGGVVLRHRARALEPRGDACVWPVRGGERTIPISALYRDDGIQYLAKQPGEIVTEIVLPPADGLRSVYLKLRRRGSFDFPVLGVAAAVRMDGEIVREARIVLGAVASLPREAGEASAAAGGPAPDPGADRARRRRRRTGPRSRSTTPTSATPTARR